MRLTPLAILFFAVQSCSGNNTTELQKENKELKAELLELKQKMAQSIVIPHKQIFTYFQPVTIGSTKTTVNQEDYFSTYLVLRKLPANYQVEWTSTPEA